MQAAANRLARTSRTREADNPVIKKPHVATADDTGLLAALPIAAAIVERQTNGGLHVKAHNSRFVEMVDQSTCTALDWNEAECLKSGGIADLLHKFFDGSDVNGELDFRDGEGISSRYFRVKLAPLPKRSSGHRRCLLSVVDR